jgi:uncharacterized membrane protein YbaN (DUF454 family)
MQTPLTRAFSGGIVWARVSRWSMLAAGWLFVLLGIAGLFLPILQGILFILIGLLILSSEYVWANRLLEKVKQRFPTLATQAHTVSQRVHQWLHRCLHRPEGKRH